MDMGNANGASTWDSMLRYTLVKTKSLEQVQRIVLHEDHYRILLRGLAGIGKTTHLKIIARVFTDKVLPILYGSELTGDESFDKYQQDILLLDDLDRCANVTSVLHQLQSSNIERIICTSRSAITDAGFFSRIIELPPLTQIELSDFIRKLHSYRAISIYLCSLMQDRYSQLIEKTFPDAYRIILDNINSSEEVADFFNVNKFFLYQYSRNAELDTQPIIIPERFVVPKHEIIRSVSAINNSLLKRVRDDPRIIKQLTPRQFEEMVCELLDKQGYSVNLTKQTKDGGKDIIVVRKDVLGEFLIYVECKKYDSQRPVGVGLVRQLYGTVMADNATAGMLVTSSFFSHDAIEYTKTVKNRMSLMDYNALVKKLY